jgi:drug/metabolite transporter (DMT)-like permease
VSTSGVRKVLLNPGVMATFASAALFGLGTPLAKSLLASVDPWLLAGLLYGGSGIALTVLRALRPHARERLARAEFGYLAGAVAAGGVAAPVLLMFGLSMMPAAGASLLLNAEGVFTALLAWIVFRENVDHRVALGMFAIAAGAVLLSWTPGLRVEEFWPSLLVLAACLAWAIDNNLTRKLSLLDATWLASVKGLVSGGTNLTIALLVGASWPSLPNTIGALGIGALAYGVSFVLFIVGLRHLGAARTTAYFSTAPFVGALVAILWLHEPLTLKLFLAAVLMAFGLWLHLTERHEHEHLHPEMEHEHEHTHDEHHLHAHPTPVPPGTRHSHRHRHVTLRHTHGHFPDAHHQHGHEHDT